MTTSQLPARPDLAQLKKQAKDLLHAARDQDPAALARFRILPSLAAKTGAELPTLTLALHDAQSVIAREHGLPSWNALRERVEELTLQFDEAIAQFTRGSVEQRIGRAERLLALHPNLVIANFQAALALGEVAPVARALAADPGLATRAGGPLNWPPLLYVAHSRWAVKNSAGLVAIARLLLERGADPNTSYPWQGDPKAPLSALWAASCHSRHLALARVLLEAGARPDDGESMFHAAEHGDIPMLDLLAAHGAQIDGGTGAGRWNNTPLFFILGHYAGSAQDADVRRGVAWLLDHGANPNYVCYPTKAAETPLHVAARRWDAPMIQLLLARGADVHARRADGRTPLTLALLHGRTTAADALCAHGAVDELTPPEQFLAACMRGDTPEALRLLDPAALAAHAAVFLEASIAAQTTMLACGIDVGSTGTMGETALHWAAFTGNLAKIQFLIARGAPLDVRDRIHHARALGWCDYAATHQPNYPRADYVGVARALLAAGATPPTPEELEHWGNDDVIAVVLEFIREKKPKA